MTDATSEARSEASSGVNGQAGASSPPWPPVLLEHRTHVADVCNLQGIQLKILEELDAPTDLEAAAALPRIFRVASYVEHAGGPAISPTTSLLWVGCGEADKAVRRLRDALRRAEREGALRGLPRSLDHWQLDSGHLLLTSDDRQGNQTSSTREAFRQKSPPDIIELMIGTAVVVERLHRAGFGIRGFDVPDLLVLDGQLAALRCLGRLVSLSELTSDELTEVISRDIESFGEILLEVATGEPVEASREILDHMLQDVQVLVDNGLARPGLSQVLVGTLAGEYPFMYPSMQELLAGLLQLRAEMAPSLTYRSALLSTAGNFPLRRSDQDSCGVTETRVVYHGIQRHIGFYCVADGVGGEEHGERASQAAVHAALGAFHRAVGRYGYDQLRGSVTSMARGFVKVASQHLAIKGEVEPEENRGATTFTGLFITGDRAGIGHLGDSRAYLMRDRTLIRLTRDHNLANVKVALGELTEKEAERSADDQRRISRFIGTAGETPTSWIDGFDPRLLPHIARPAPRDERPMTSHRPVLAAPAPTPMAMPRDMALGETMELPDMSGVFSEDTLENLDNPFANAERTAPKRHVFDAAWEDEARLAHLEVKPGDRFMIMSDGLYGELSDDVMAEILMNAPEPNVAARRLLDSALVGMSMDNVSVVVVFVGEGQPNLRF